MPHLTPWLLIFAISTPLLLHLSVDTRILVRAARVSHVYTIAFVARHALRPREWQMIRTDLLSHSLLPSDLKTPWATPHVMLTELNHFNLAAYGLQLPLPTL